MNRPMQVIDRFIDGITMYRLLLYYLIGLLLVAMGLSLSGHLGYSAVAIALSALYVVAICLISNVIFAKVYNVPAATDSAYITALILALIITPLPSTQNMLFLTAAGGLAMASKYMLNRHGKHVFNPAAVAVLLTSLGPGQTASWWVGNTLLLPFVVIGGLLLVRKIRRGRMVAIFFLAALLSTVIVHLLTGSAVTSAVQAVLLHSPLFFLGFVMLTEPLTTPPTVSGRSWYAALVGALFPPQVHIFSLYSTPELALIVGNVFSYVISPKVRLVPRVLQKLQVAPDIVDFEFSKQANYTYRAGQYVEVTLGHQHVDSRGNRRYLTLASSPTEDTLRLGVKFYPDGSSFKQAMLGLDRHASLTISPPAGDFTLPDDASRKLAFIAGGIGITPYRSMIKYLIDNDDRRSTVLLYAEKSPAELVYTDVFTDAARLGLKTVYSVSHAPADWSGRRGHFTPEVIREEIPDYLERLFYISGPLQMVAAMKDGLRKLGVPEHQVKTDYFPGYA